MHTSSSLRCALMLAGALLTLPLVLRAQGITTGSIRGRITSTEGAIVASAQITASNMQTGLTRNSIANEAGVYVASLLPPGIYRVRIQRIGFAPFARDSVQVRLNASTPLDVALIPAATQLSEVTVTGQGQLTVDTRRTGVAEYVSEREIETLPTLGRDFTDFIALSGLVSPQPEVTTGGTVAIGGGRTSGVNVQIDGADANFNFFGESRGGARIPFTFSLESIKEFQVITNGFDVEFGNYSSGVVNVVTKGGTNDFQGTLLGYFRDDNLTNSDFEQTVLRGGVPTLVGGTRPNQFEVQQFAGNVSGPVVRDKLHFLLSYDGQRRRDPNEAGTVLGTGLSADSIARFIQILESTYGLTGARNEFGRFERTNDVGVFFGRLDWTVNDRHRASFRANYADYASDNDGIQFGGARARTFAATFADRNLSVVGELTSVLTPTTFNVFRMQFATERRPRTSNNFLPLATVTVEPGRTLGFGGSGITYRNDLRETKVQLINNLTHTRGGHTLKVGTNNTFSEIFNKFWLFGAGEYRFNSLADFQARRPASYSRNIPQSGPKAPETTFGIQEFGVYAQDEWQATSRLVATFGLRYDLNRYGDDFVSVQAVDTLSGLGDPRIGLGGFRTGNSPSDNDNISPRVSLAYDLFGDSRHVLRAGAGLFYGRVPGVLGSNVGTGADPYLSVFCTGANVPDPNYSAFQQSRDGSANPDRCNSGAAPTGNRQYTFWANDFEYPETFKTSIGYEGRVFDDTRVGVDFLYGRTRNNFTTVDLALRTDPVFALASENGRPVYASAASFNPLNAASATARSRYIGASYPQGIDRIFVNTSQGVADEYAVTLRADQRLGFALLRGSYTYNWAKDNSSFVCCTNDEALFGEPVAGSLNDKGERGGPEWGNSRFVRPHTVILSGIVNLPWNFQVTGIYRANSGSFYTPGALGDLNADGRTGNDRPFIGRADQLLFDRPQDRVAYEQLLSENECLRENVGSIIGRNECPNPWFHQLDVGVRYEIPLRGERGVELVADFFNVANAFNSDWGRLRRVGQTTLLDARSYDSATGRVRYRVNDRFGENVFIGPTRQFQTQLGVRLSF